jgi:hypothetical protein
MTTTQSNTIVLVAWALLIVVAELFAFYLIQKSVDEQSGLFSVKMIVSVLLFGIVVTYSFRQILYGGTNIPIANLYWVIFSQVGSVLMAYYLFNQKIYIKDYIAVVLLFLAVIIIVFGKTE